MPSETNYVCELSRAQADSLKAILAERGWSLDTLQYALWRARKEKTTVVAYESGKMTAQGKGTGDFVRYILEPEVLHEARFGYESELAQQENPEMFLPHAGIDESGKGDYFGPLVIACVYTDARTAPLLLKEGVADSKTIKSDARIFALDSVIKRECDGQYTVITVGPAAYNRLYLKIGNLNRLLAWGHARALESLLEMVPDCPRAISDQFARSPFTVKQALMEKGRGIKLEQHPRAEADVAVAAASILARAAFVRYLEHLSEEAGMPLPKGGGPLVKETAAILAKKLGLDKLGNIAKLHFKITSDAIRDEKN